MILLTNTNSFLFFSLHSSLQPIFERLGELGAKRRRFELQQGRNVKWVVAWSFFPRTERRKRLEEMLQTGRDGPNEVSAARAEAKADAEDQAFMLELRKILRPIVKNKYFDLFVWLLRFGKAIHTIKNVKGFKVIWLLLSGLFASAGTLFWSCLLLATSVLFFSIIAVDLIGYADAWTYQPEDAIPRWFISLRSSMFTMSRFMSSDGAMDVVEYLMQAVSFDICNVSRACQGQPYIWIFLFAFEALSQYVILNLVTAVICDNSMKIVSEDEANRAAEAEEEKKKQIEELRELFKLLDSDDSGEVDTEEFDGAFEIPALKNKLLLLGLDEKELKRFFRALDSDGSGSMGIDEFCEGIPELFGQATAFSMLKAKKKVKSQAIESHQELHCDRTENQLGSTGSTGLNRVNWVHYHYHHHHQRHHHHHHNNHY
ncbi:Ribosomal RNA large subunit methyltransferase F [Durusdinium trenchii]|uniref:Ribosomal RNA large subunit methyltransferase F n=1 Tax=Durusdinium trenchii TaxID=1381693 RepID=A0ABP0LB25_9DINO